MSVRKTRPRSAFALLAVLWILIGIGVLATVAGSVGRRSTVHAQREIDRLIGRWHAEACIERVRALLDESNSLDGLPRAPIWRHADRILHSTSNGVLVGCDLSMRPFGRLLLGQASIASLDSVPGMTPEAILRAQMLEENGYEIADLVQLEGGLSSPAKAVFDANYQTLTQRIVLDPDGWEVQSQAHFGMPPTSTHITVRLARSGTRIAVIRWIEVNE